MSKSVWSEPTPGSLVMFSRITQFVVAVGNPAEEALIRSGLGQLGLNKVISAASGPAAQKLLGSHQPHVVIAAWELPGLGGLRLVKQIRAGRDSADWPCVLVVQERHESEIYMAEGVEVSGFLPRPLTEAGVAAKVREILRVHEAALWPQADEERADRLVDEGHLNEALDDYQAVIENGKNKMAGIQAEIGLILIEKGDYEQAIDYLERAVLVQPHIASAHAALGQAYLETGRPAEAHRALERARTIAPLDEQVQKDLAESLLRSEQFGLAEGIFRKLLQQKPDDEFLLNRLGISLRRQRKFQEAITHYRQAIGINNQEENLYFNLGRCLFDTGQFEEAITALNQALNINPNMGEARQLLAKIR